MIREKKKILNRVYFVTDIFTIFISYIVAVYFRYNIMSSLPGLNTLSTPYLLISFAYCVIISSVFYYLRMSSRKYELFTINAVGCLTLFAFFYVIGELYFSRWALVLFWFVSSVFLTVKSFVLKNLFDKRSWNKTKNKRILVVGDGEILFDYLRALHWDNACGFQVIGYVGNKSQYFFEQEFCGEKIDKKNEGWQGCYENLQDVIEREKPDQIVFALDDNEKYRLKSLKKIVKGIPSSIALSMFDCVPVNARLQKVDEMTLIDLEPAELEHKESIRTLVGVILSVLMLLMLIIRKFDIAGYQGNGTFDDLRCYLFALIGFLLLSEINEKVKGKHHSGVIGTIITMVIMAIIIVVYENFYGEVIAILTDFKVTGCVLLISLILFSVGKDLDTDNWFLL